ncbi:MAG: thymidylate synthase [Actinobacteria bacterium]|nr:MAG: thymidylate synthase [Actinomycetota bacterium]
MTHPYVVEEFTSAEREVLSRYFTNVDRPVFCVVDLPEIVKGALFARYSRTKKSLRRLFLDEFYDGSQTGAAAGKVGSAKAEELYDRIFIEYGDDSVAQLGGAHIAVEQCSNVLTKVIERGRLAGYLEQSTRYVPYDDRPGGRWRYYLEPSITASPHAATYREAMDRMFELYAASVEPTVAAFRERYPQQPEDPDRVYTASIRAKALDALRGMLPAATVSNLGVYASGQAYEMMLFRLLASPLAEAQAVGEMMLAELRAVIPSFLVRVDQPNRGGEWIDYLRNNRSAMREMVSELFAGEEPEPRPLVTLTAWDDDAEEALVAAMLYPYSDLPEDRLLEIARKMPFEERVRVLRTYVGERRNRRHKPGRAFERASYRFDVLGDYGGFRDMQRHRMLTIDWQELTPGHGYELPPEAEELGFAVAYREAVERSAGAWERIHPDLPDQAAYAVSMAYRIRYVMQMNLREAFHVIELRSSPQGHAAYRKVAHEMYRQIADVAGHRTVAEFMRYVDLGDVDLERLDAERRAERKRQEAARERSR